jgi:hypothetical protein
MERRRPSLIGPLVLITIGILVLMANLGLLPFSFWELAYRYWPLILILAGLEMVFGRQSVLGRLIVIIVWFAIIAGILWLSFSPGNAFVSSTRLVTDQLKQPLDDIKSAAVELNLGFATTNISALGSDATDLMIGTFNHVENASIVKSYNIVDGEGRLALREQGMSWRHLASPTTAGILL